MFAVLRKPFGAVKNFFRSEEDVLFLVRELRLLIQKDWKLADDSQKWLFRSLELRRKYRLGALGLSQCLQLG